MGTHQNRFTWPYCARPLLFAAWLLLSASASAQTVRFTTNLGEIDVQLLRDDAPGTVANFLNYVNKGAYNNTIFHRSVKDFVIQAGGFRWQGSISEILSDPPVRNEYKISNTRGTIAMAKLGSGPDTATNQWFFNLGDNSANLNNQNGGFTVFGRITNDAGLAVMDAIARIPVVNCGSPFDAFPLNNTTSCTAFGESNLAIVKSVTTLSGVPAVSENGILTATGFGGFGFAAPGSFIEIYGTNFIPAEQTSRGWASTDFNGSNAPTSLDGVSVTIGGRVAYVNYISPGQINVQVPGNVPSGSSLPLVINSRGLVTAPMTLQIRARAPGVLAPASFKVGDRQYVVAVRPNGTFVANGSIPNVPAAPAVPGETVTLYGTGFGFVRGASIGGQIAAIAAPLIDTVEVKLSGQSATVSYAGLAPGLVGVYQINLIIPSGVPDGDAQLEVITGGEPLAGQTLFLPVKN